MDSVTTKAGTINSIDATPVTVNASATEVESDGGSRDTRPTTT